jgi:hypothetical protein
MEGYTCDTGKLHQVGAQDLPALADALRSVRGALADTEDHWAPAFREDRMTLESLYGDTERLWNQACNGVFAILGEAANRIDRIGDALVNIADNYCAADSAAAIRAAGVLDVVADG